MLRVILWQTHHTQTPNPGRYWRYAFNPKAIDSIIASHYDD